MPDPWRKLGRVLAADGGPLSRTHAMVPTPYVMGDRVRVFYAACDADMRGRVFYADFEPEPPFRLMRRRADPVLDLGPPGAFDCDGVNPSQALDADGRLALVYIGWRCGPPEQPYTLFGGVAFSDDGGESFAKAEAPLLAPRAGERLFRTAPFIEAQSDGFRMLYVGGDSFVAGDRGRPTPTYSLMELRSPDLWTWDGSPRTLLAPDLARGETGFGRPVVARHRGETRLVLSLRTRQGYRLVVTTADWPSGDRPGFTPVIPPPMGAWEQQMTCFGAPCRVGDYELLFYNGDGYGRTGAGLCWRRWG